MAKRVAMLRSKSVGGVEPRLDKEARALAGAGYEVHAILWDRDLAYPAEEERNGYAVHRVRVRAPYGRKSLIWKLPQWWRRAYRLLVDLTPNAIHAIDLDTLPPVTMARRHLGAKRVFDVWDFYGDMITQPLPEWLRRWIHRRERVGITEADLVIVPDLVRSARLSGVPIKRLIEVMNVPEDQDVVGERQERFTLFYGGNIARDRGLPQLLRACEATGAVLVVAGQGPDESELLPLIESSPNATFLGSLPYGQVLKWTASADAIPALYDPAIPNNRLASPGKIFEAMMLSKPVLVTEGIAAGDTVREAGCGLSVPYGDTAALTAAIERLMLSPDLCRDLGAKGRVAFEERYNWAIMERRLLEAYESLGF